MSGYRKTDKDPRGEGKARSGANVKFTGVTKPKGPTSEELKAEIKGLKESLRQCTATNTLLRMDKAGDQANMHVDKYAGDHMFQTYKDGYENVTAELKKLESQSTGSNPSAQGQDTKENEDLQKIIAAKDKENTDLKNTVAEHGQQITGLQQQLNDAKRELEETQKKLKEEAKTPIPQLSQDDNNQIQKLKDELKDSQNKIEAKEKELSKLKDDNNTIRAKSAKADQGDKAAQDKIRGLEDAHTELNNTLKAQIDGMTSEKEAASSEIAQFKLEVQKRDQEIKDKNNAIEQADNKISKLEKEVEAVTKDREIFKRQASSLGDQGPTEPQERSDPSTEEVDNKRGELEKKKSELETKNKELQSLKNKNADLEQKCHEAFSRLDEKDKIAVIEKKEQKSKIEQKEETINKLRKELSMLKVSGDSDKDTKETMKKLEDELGTTKDTLNNMTKEKANLLKKMELRGGDHERELMAEVESLKSRLSKMAGAQLMDNNPNIADLSDENRATKLGERYSEVYDNEWTDCYEELENSGKNEQECINYLMNMLLTVSKSCAELSVKQMSQLKATALSVPGKENKRPSNTEIRVTQQRQLKELRKAFARDTVPPVVEQCKAESNLNFSGKPAEEKYFKACVELCWFMNVQDPPVILQAPPKTGLKFDGDSYRSYTRTGKTVDYPVWPTMLLHENGPILLKGVVQAK